MRASPASLAGAQGRRPIPARTSLAGADARCFALPQTSDTQALKTNDERSTAVAALQYRIVSSGFLTLGILRFGERLVIPNINSLVFRRL